MFDTTMTLVGNVCDEPKLRITKNGHSVASFRVASTPRRFDREANQYVDCPTLFLTVVCWRTLADNVAESLHKGQPVVVHGRFYSRSYEVDEALRFAYELEATAVGPDLSRGTAEFRRSNRGGSASSVPADEDGLPADDSAHWTGSEPAEQGASGGLDSRPLVAVS